MKIFQPLCWKPGNFPGDGHPELGRMCKGIALYVIDMEAEVSEAIRTLNAFIMAVGFAVNNV